MLQRIKAMRLLIEFKIAAFGWWKKKMFVKFAVVVWFYTLFWFFVVADYQKNDLMFIWIFGKHHLWCDRTTETRFTLPIVCSSITSTHRHKHLAPSNGRFVYFNFPFIFKRRFTKFRVCDWGERHRKVIQFLVPLLHLMRLIQPAWIVRKREGKKVILIEMDRILYAQCESVL